MAVISSKWIVWDWFSGGKICEYLFVPYFLLELQYPPSERSFYSQLSSSGELQVVCLLGCYSVPGSFPMYTPAISPVGCDSSFIASDGPSYTAVLLNNFPLHTHLP